MPASSLAFSILAWLQLPSRCCCGIAPSRSFPLAMASLFFFAQPLSGAIFAALLLNQEMTLALWMGGALIAAAVLLSLFQRAARCARQARKQAPSFPRHRQ